MSDLEKRLSDLEQRTAQRRLRNDPRRMLLVACQLSLMDATIPRGDDGSPERQKQLDRVDRLERAYQTGDVNTALPDLEHFGFAGSEPWRPIHVEQPTPPNPLEN